MPAEPRRRKLTPPEIAARYGISPDKVLRWIKEGELAAINAATRPGGRPRFLIDEAYLAAFEKRRAAIPAPKLRRSRGKDEFWALAVCVSTRRFTGGEGPEGPSPPVTLGRGGLSAPVAGVPGPEAPSRAGGPRLQH
jgi:hypothetical protein